MTKFTTFLLDTLTGSPAKGLSRRELSEERRAQLAAIPIGIGSAVILFGLNELFWRFIAYCAAR
nr:MAG TPA: Transthyretin-like protein-related protein, 5-hydroxyisourate hydrolase, HYDROLASE [Caudoviricetes sp.]